MIYKLYKTSLNQTSIRIDREDGSAICIPFAPANTDYQRFKQDIANGAELQDADGNVMSADDAQAFIQTLP